MNLLVQMNRAMEYIEEHICDEIDFKQMARIAECSEYHFRRMFSYLARMPLGEYIRCRKLSVAGELLQRGNKVIDCAVMMGYDSADAFRKAFEAMHGIHPSQAKCKGVTLKTFPPMTFQLTIKGGDKMEYRIVHKTDFFIVGYKKRITLQFEGINTQMDSVIALLTPSVVAQLKELCNTEPAGMLNVSANIEDQSVEGTELDQYIGVATTKQPPKGYDTLRVEESDWAVFTVVGPFPQTVQNTWSRIYAEWLPSSSFQLKDGPSLLWYESPDLTKPDCKNEIWISVEQKAL